MTTLRKQHVTIELIVPAVDVDSAEHWAQGIIPLAATVLSIKAETVPTPEELRGKMAIVPQEEEF